MKGSSLVVIWNIPTCILVCKNTKAQHSNSTTHNLLKMVRTSNSWLSGMLIHTEIKVIRAINNTVETIINTYREKRHYYVHTTKLPSNLTIQLSTTVPNHNGTAHPATTLYFGHATVLAIPLAIPIMQPIAVSLNKTIPICNQYYGFLRWAQHSFNNIPFLLLKR